MTDEVKEVKRYFEEKGIPLSIEWLKPCVEWCKEDNLPPSYTFKDLQMLVYYQWLILDLREVEISSLPRSLSSQKKFSLTGTYYLQVLQVVDISKPKLWQLQRIRNNNVTKNVDYENNFGKRVLMLTLTDGVQEVEAMEFKPISSLNINLDPGLKIKLTGPITVRNGTLMLEDQHVKILGGCVDEIKVKNAAENVLARALGLEENPQPFAIDEKILEDPNTNTTAQSTRSDIPQNTAARNQNNTNRIKTAIQITAKSCNIPPTHQRNNEIPPEFQVDDELLRELQEDFDCSTIVTTKKPNLKPENSSLGKNVPTASTNTQIPKPMANTQTQRTRKTSSSSLDFFDIDDDLLNEHLDQIDEDDMLVNLESCVKKPKVDCSSRKSTNTTNKITTTVNVNKTEKDRKSEENDEIIILDDSFESIDIDSHLDKIDEELACLPSSTQVINSFKKRITSPELKSKKSNPQKLIQSKISFGTLNTPRINFSQAEFKKTEKLIKEEAVSSTTSPISIPSTSKAIHLDRPSQHLNVPSSQDNIKSPKPLTVMSIEKFKNLLPNVSRGKFKIKAKFKKVAEKIRSVNKCFYFIIVVEDDSGELTVQVHSNVVEGFAGISAEKLEELKEFALKDDKDVKSTIVQALANIHRKSVSIDNILELQVTRGEKCPVIVNIL